MQENKRLISRLLTCCHHLRSCSRVHARVYLARYTSKVRDALPALVKCWASVCDAQHYPSTVWASGAVWVYGLCLLVSVEDTLVLSEEMASVLPSPLMGAILSILVTLHSWYSSLHILQHVSSGRWPNFGILLGQRRNWNNIQLTFYVWWDMALFKTRYIKPMSMLLQRRRRWNNVIAAFIYCTLFAGLFLAQ